MRLRVAHRVPSLTQALIAVFVLSFVIGGTDAEAQLYPPNSVRIYNVLHPCPIDLGEFSTPKSGYSFSVHWTKITLGEATTATYEARGTIAVWSDDRTKIWLAPRLTQTCWEEKRFDPDKQEYL